MSKKSYCSIEEQLGRRNLISNYAISFGVSKRKFVKTLGFKNLKEAVKSKNFRYHLERYQKFCEMQTENMLFEYDYGCLIKDIIRKEMETKVVEA